MASVWDYASNARAFLSRHKRTLMVATAVGASSVAALAYVRFKPMYDQIRAELRAMERLTADMQSGEGAQQELLHRFNHNLAVCDQTLRKFVAQAKVDIAARFDVVAIRAQIKRTSLAPSHPTASSSFSSSSSSSAPAAPSASEEQSARERAHDLAKWNEFKLSGFSRTLTAMYCATLLHALVKVQLSIVSRYVLQEQQPPQLKDRSALGGVAVLGLAMSEEVNRAYFGLSEWGQQDGLRRLGDVVEEAVTAEMTRWELNASCTVEDIQMIIVHIRHRVDAAVAARSRTADDDSVPVAAAPPSLPSSASPFLSFLYPPTAVIESKLDAMEPQLREAARTAISAASPTAPLPTASPGALTALASSRLYEMAAETLSVLHSETFAQAVESSLSSAFDLLLSSLLSALPSGGAAMPFASVMVKSMKLFDTLLPDAGGGLYDVLSGNVQVRQMCEVIFFPMDEHGRNVVNAPHPVPVEPASPSDGHLSQLRAMLAASRPAVGGEERRPPQLASGGADRSAGEARGGRLMSGEGTFDRG